MMEYIFVSVMCIGSACDFMTSKAPLSREKCQEVKQQFMKLPFKPEVTLAAAQCISIDTGEKI